MGKSKIVELDDDTNHGKLQLARKCRLCRDQETFCCNLYSSGQTTRMIARLYRDPTYLVTTVPPSQIHTSSETANHSFLMLMVTICATRLASFGWQQDCCGMERVNFFAPEIMDQILNWVGSHRNRIVHSITRIQNLL